MLVRGLPLTVQSFTGVKLERTEILPLLVPFLQREISLSADFYVENFAWESTVIARKRSDSPVLDEY